MFTEVWIKFLFISLIYTPPFVTTNLFYKEYNQFAILNHKTTNEKVKLRFIQDNEITIQSKVKLDSVPTLAFTHEKVTSEISRIEAICGDKIGCTSLLENDINVIAIAQNKFSIFAVAKNYFCKSGKNSEAYLFTPCFLPYSSEKLSMKDQDDYVNIVYQTNWHVKEEGYTFKLKKADGSEVDIDYDGSEKEIFDFKGTSAPIREVYILPRKKYIEGFWDANIWVFVEGKGALEYRLDKSYGVDSRIKYLPTHYNDITLKMDRDSTGLSPFKPKKMIFDVCDSGKNMGSLNFEIYGQNSESFELQVPLNDLCRTESQTPYIELYSLNNISYVEVTCAEAEDFCKNLVENNFHVMATTEKFGYNQQEVDGYFCKREKLSSGKYLYVRCNEKLSDSARNQKKQDQYVHLVYFRYGSTYLKEGTWIEAVLADGVRHKINVEEKNRKVHDFLGSSSTIKYVQVPFNAAHTNVTGISIFTEGNGVEHCVLYREDKRESDSSKFYNTNIPSELNED